MLNVELFAYANLELRILSFELLLNYGKNVALTHDEVFCTLNFKLCARIFAVKDFITFLKNHFLILSAIASGNDSTVLRFLFCCIRNDDSANFLFCLCRKYKHSVC